MASIRDRIIAAAITALNTGAPGGVPTAERVRTADLEPSDLPSIIVYPTRTSPDPLGGGERNAVRARLSFNVECRAAGTGSIRPDEAIDPLCVWVIKALGGKRLSDGAGGFLNHDIVEGETTFVFEQGAAPYCLASVEMTAVYQYLVSNPESRV